MLAWLALPGTESRRESSDILQLARNRQRCRQRGGRADRSGGRHIAELSRNWLRCRRLSQDADWRVPDLVQRVYPVLRCLHRNVIRNTVGRIGPEIGRDLFGGIEARADIVTDVIRIGAELQSSRAIDLHKKVRGVDFLL